MIWDEADVDLDRLLHCNVSGKLPKDDVGHPKTRQKN